MMNTATDKQAAARHAAILEEVNRHRATRRRLPGIVHTRRRPGYCKGVADALSLLVLAYIIGSGAWLCAQFLLSLIF